MKTESKGKNRWLPSIKDARICALKKKKRKKSVISKKILKIKKTFALVPGHKQSHKNLTFGTIPIETIHWIY